MSETAQKKFCVKKFTLLRAIDPKPDCDKCNFHPQTKGDMCAKEEPSSLILFFSAVFFRLKLICVKFQHDWELSHNV